MENIDRVTAHIRMQERGSNRLVGQSLLTPVRARDGKPFCRDDSGEYWRLWPYVYGARTFDTVRSATQAREAAAAFGYFQCLLHDLPGPRLHETISRFHDTPARFAQFREALASDAFDRAKLSGPEIDVALSHEEHAGVLAEAHQRGEIPERIVHNDAKINNVLFDDATGQAVCVVDLDTVMPGLAVFDFGDLVRTATMPVAEDETDLEKVAMQFDMYAQLVDGYLSTAIGFLQSAEIEKLAIAGRIITVETGLRFLTDYLAGDKYFRTRRPNHNLDRCRTQFALVDSIDEQLPRMQSVTESTYARLEIKR